MIYQGNIIYHQLHQTRSENLNKVHCDSTRFEPELSETLIVNVVELICL